MAEIAPLKLAVEHECPSCGGLHSSEGEVETCLHLKIRDERRERARKFAKTGLSQKGVAK